jgi:hypothetical protein
MITPLLLSVLWLATALTPVPECRDKQLQHFVARIEDVRDVQELAVLRKKPSEAAACLIHQLRVVDVTVLRPDERSRRPEDFRTIWSIRALRYLTGGKDFCAPTAHFDELDKDRQQFLTIRCGPGPDVSFFGVWMSRDVIYVAPEDAQEKIIQQWLNWYETEGIRYSYPPTRDVDWYF